LLGQLERKHKLFAILSTCRRYAFVICAGDAREIYFDFYVKTGDASENKIKEVKNMCFSDRLSNHGFWGNFFRLFLSSLAYEMFLLLKKAIRKTKFKAARKWRISTIRAALPKVGATIRVTKRRVNYRQ
jgi:hypothetical protein